MKRFFVFPLLLLFVYSCGPLKYGIKRKKVIPEEDVRVVLDPKIIISGFKGEDNRETGVDLFGIKVKNSKKKDDEIKMRPVKEINNERKLFEFYIPPGEQEIAIQSRYTHGSYIYRSEDKTVTLNGKKGDIIFVCTGIQEVGNQSQTGGVVRTVIEPQPYYLKDQEKTMIFRKTDSKNKEINKKVDTRYFKKKCNSIIYGIPEE